MEAQADAAAPDAPSHSVPRRRSSGVVLPPFQRLVDEHWRDVSRLARALSDPSDADDVAQQSWAQAYAAYPRLRSSVNLRGWLLTITHRCAMDQHRSRGRRAVPTDDALVLEAFGGTAPGPDAGVVDSALWVRVARLPERQREAVVLKYVADLDHPRIAEMLGTTPTMSRRLVSDGLKTLRKDL
ncbi:MAG: RNA polymerase sigma factor [Actinomycetota bacterium]|nr:RNA polymerase sigma factor [Actinomycetota bacterium]